MFGIRLFVKDQKLIKLINERYILNLDLIVFAYHHSDELSDFSFENTEYKFFIEALDIKLNDTLDGISPHGLILKGNEAPGKVSGYASFVLMQWYLENSSHPVFIHGGVGFYTAAGMFAAGAAGVVLDDQLYLSEEAPVSDDFKALIESLEEKDSVLVGQTLNVQYRFFAKLGTKIVKTLKEKEAFLCSESGLDSVLYDEIRSNMVALDDPDATPIQSLFYLGQDAVFSRYFVKQSKKLKDIIHAFFKQIEKMLLEVDEHDPLRPDSSLAREHGTKLPLIQGPMANVSDNADFALKVFENGALPFFAMGNLPVNLAEDMLSAGKEKVARFGAGMIGIEAFNRTIHDHFRLVKEYKVPFALFAGGVPSQVKDLESAGVKTYLHTPSLMMLENAVTHDCTRFIFEGTEAGGHVGSLTSCVLWELALERLFEQSDDMVGRQSLIFAGGVATASGSHFISGISSIFAKRGAKIGIQVGSAYLFTREIVDTGAIKKQYQDIICDRHKTFVIGNTVGLPSRTVLSPFSEKMIENEQQRIKEGMPLKERKTAFEGENMGSMLIASKCYSPVFNENREFVKLQNYTDEEQFRKGNFNVGDSLAFFSCCTAISDIHDRYFNSKDGLIHNLNSLEVFSSEDHQINDEIAVIGMGCIYPDAHDTQVLWDNILSKKYSIKQLPKNRCDTDLYYDEDKTAEDKSYTQIAGVIDDFEFDYEKYGYTKEKAENLSRTQQMILETAYQALADTGYIDENLRIRENLRKRTAVIVGTCLANELSYDLQLKYYYPEIKFNLDQIDAFKSLDLAQRETFLEELKSRLYQGSAYDPAHGVTLNIEASRIAYHMGIEGVNYVVDAACATSFSAMDCGIKELMSGDHDMIIVGGANTNLAPEPFVGFCKMGALSADGSYPFDQRANGFVIGEGSGIVVLKRMKDAIRDNDNILGTIKAMAASSDGKGKAIAAPNTLGQSYALTRCFEKIKTDVDFSDIDYIEAHGTSTIMGDIAEIETLKQVYKSDTPIGISSIKSQIGHLLGGAGTAGLIKVLLAINHKTLPPNGLFETLAKKHDIENTPLYIIEEPKKWEVKEGKSRMAAVSSFGFGGINYHCVLEEYTNAYKPLPRSIFSNPEYDFNDDRIVIAGLGVVLPGAENVEQFWDRLVEGKPVVSEIPDSRFHNDYYAQEPADSYYRIPKVKAGMVQDYKFNNVKYRIPPAAAKSVDRAQLFALDATSQAIERSNLQPQLVNGNKIGVVLGTISGEQNVENVLRVRTDFIKQVIFEIPGTKTEVKAEISEKLSELLNNRYVKNTEDTIPGLLSNIVSGRIANFFNCNAANFVVDA
ncbi:MAG: nitronate monooxygenase, partial [Deltaproteobacteria bacterium]|nr:nitronate monooxygenase [Deltaproteobacteria bacterium]